MPSISSSPQEEVGQSHLSRRVPLARSDAPAGAATRGIRAPWRAAGDRFRVDVKRSEGSAQDGQDEVKNCSYRSGAGFRFPGSEGGRYRTPEARDGAQLRSRARACDSRTHKCHALSRLTNVSPVSVALAVRNVRKERSLPQKKEKPDGGVAGAHE